MDKTNIEKTVESFLSGFDTINIPRGGISGDDFNELYALIEENHYNTNHNRDRIKIIEIGCWTGLASALLGSIAKKHQGNLTTVDWFKGVEGYDGTKLLSSMDRVGRYVNVKQIWLDLMKSLDLDGYITLIDKKSSEAVDSISNDSADVIFIDGDHRYDYFRKDLEMWYPKLKNGGIICGHDCDYLFDSSNSFIEKASNIDCVGLHLGVSRALWEVFPDAKKTETGVIWYKRKC